ncbi:hypothetical protein [Helicobacter sp. UBA3407]|uniref:hypothetical protein n=1 Tax=Helicobacter sp. UBA3407 TaxID=1946588 RepID=UPI0026330B0B|nr:hypothetical protein [Helicobacter sp. UBA3407]
MANPTFYGRGKVLGDLLVKTQLSVNATFPDATEDNPVGLGTAVIVRAGDNGGYTATAAPANEANGILLQTINNASDNVGVLVNGEIKAEFYGENPLSADLRTSLLKSGIVLR